MLLMAYLKMLGFNRIQPLRTFPSYKMNPDFWGCFEVEKTHKGINKIIITIWTNENKRTLRKRTDISK